MSSLIRTLSYYGFFRNHLYFYPRYGWEMILRRFSSRRRVMLAEVFFEGRCNLHCWHCSSAEYIEKKKAKSLSLEELEGVVRKLSAVGVLTICYVGGEPTINKQLLDIVRMTNRHRILPTIISNATLLNPEKIDALFKAGLANLGFSMQSALPRIHDDLVRRPGSLEHMREMIDYCLRKKYTVSICVVPTNENLANGDFGALVAYAREKDIRMNVNLPAPVGKWMDTPECALTPESVAMLRREYFSLPNFMPDFKQTSASRKVRCPMGEDNLYILPDGEVCPCTFTHVSFGNILTESPEDILRRMDASPTLMNVARDGMCPISMDKEFIAKVHKAIKSSLRYPPRGDEIGF